MKMVVRCGLLVVLCAVMHVSSQTGQVCELTFNACLEDFHRTTIDVPENVVALTSRIHACRPTQVEEGAIGTPPSIVFVIDHSGSMSSGNTARDRNGSRFTVTNALLDTIRRVQPNAEVSVVVFTEHLYLDRTSSQYFATHFRTLSRTMDGNADQAYLGFLTLDQTYGTRTGREIIRDVLATQQATQNNQTFTDLAYKPNFTPSNRTNITIAFMAAREAFKTAKNPPERQFIIFLSDGEPNVRTSLTDSYPIRNDFQLGTDLPTTFTVFFTDPTEPNAPQSIVTMTNNI